MDAGRRRDRRDRGGALSTEGIDFSELLRSPLEPDRDEREPRGPQWPVVAALLLGVVAGWILVSGFEGEADPVSEARQPVSTTAEGPEVAIEANPFPDDYVEIAPDVAVRAEEPIRVADRLLVPFTTVVRRGADPRAVARPLGGRWELTTESGGLASAGTVYDPIHPSVFSVEFPVPAGAPSAIELVERWDPEPITASTELPFTGLPYESEEPIVFELREGVELVVTRLDLGNFQGRAQWELQGAPLGIVSLDVRLINPDGSVLGDYESGIIARLDPEQDTGFSDYFWGPGFGVEQNDATTFTITADVELGVPIPTDVSVPLTD